MKLATIALAALLLVSIPARGAAANEHREYGPCDAPRWLHISKDEWTPQLVKGLIRCAAERWPVDVDTALRVADCESSYWPWAIGGDNLGVFQHVDTAWNARVHNLLERRWFPQWEWANPEHETIIRLNLS